MWCELVKYVMLCRQLPIFTLNTVVIDA